MAYSQDYLNWLENQSKKASQGYFSTVSSGLAANRVRQAEIDAMMSPTRSSSMNSTASRMNQTWSNIMNPLSGSFSQTRVVPLTAEQKQQYGYTDTTQILNQLTAAQKKAEAANKLRETEIRNLYSDIIARYGPEGSFGAGYEAEIEQAKKKSIAEGTQAAVSGGLANIVGGRQAIGNLGKTFEQEVGAPARLKLEDLRAEKLSGAQQDFASFIERISDTGPDLNLIAQLLNR
jgi:hypothetical protein